MIRIPLLLLLFHIVFQKTLQTVLRYTSMRSQKEILLFSYFIQISHGICAIADMLI